MQSWGPYIKDAGQVRTSRGGGLTMESGPGVTCAEDGGSHYKPKEDGRALKQKKARKQVLPSEPPWAPPCEHLDSTAFRMIWDF